MKSGIIALTLSMLVSANAYAQNFVNPAGALPQGRMLLAGTYSASDVEYDVTNDIDISRSILGATLEYGVAPKFTLMGLAGFALDGEWESRRDVDLDSGTYFGIGGKYQVYQQGSLYITGFGMFTMLNEDFEEEINGVDVKIETDMKDMQVGAMFAYDTRTVFLPYAGLEFFLLSDGDAEVDANLGTVSSSDKEDIERDEKVNLRVGGYLKLDGLLIRPEAVLLGESSFSVSAHFQL